MTHICVSKLSIIGSDNGLSPGRRQAITWTSAGILLTGPLGTNFSAILIKTYTFSFNKIHLNLSSGNWRPFCLVLNVLSAVMSNKLLSAILMILFDRQKIILTAQFPLNYKFNTNCFKCGWIWTVGQVKNSGNIKHSITSQRKLKNI